MRLIRTLILLAGAASVLALLACSQDKEAKSVEGAAKEPAAATVNGKPISQRTVDMVAKEGANSGRPDTPESRKAIIDQLALQMLAAEEAVKKGLDKTPEVVERLEAIKRSVLANAYVQDLIKSTPVTEDMLKTEYERVKEMVGGTEYKARHILLATEAEAKDVIASLRKNPGAFAKLAAEKSKDQGSRAAGGDLGWFDPRRMVPEFGAAVSKLEKGKFTEEPVKTQFGFHVVLLEDARPIAVPSLEELKPQLSNQIQQQNLMKQLDELKAGAKIEVTAAAASEPPPAAPEKAK
jgi:peptidyl-prolyl cis-trans isomerase C